MINSLAEVHPELASEWSEKNLPLTHNKATQEIRNIPDKDKACIPIIAMTANAFEEDKRDAIAAGMNGHIAKPIEVDKLLSMLSEVIRQ